MSSRPPKPGTEEKAGLADDLLAEVRLADRRIAEHPEGFPFEEGVAQRYDIRWCPVHRFPSKLFFVQVAAP